MFLHQIPDLQSLRLDFSSNVDFAQSATNWHHEEYPGAYSICVDSCLRLLSTVNVKSLELLGDFKLHEAEQLGRSMGAERVGLEYGSSNVKLQDESWALRGTCAMKMLKPDNVGKDVAHSKSFWTRDIDLAYIV